MGFPLCDTQQCYQLLLEPEWFTDFVKKLSENRKPDGYYSLIDEDGFSGSDEKESSGPCNRAGRGVGSRCGERARGVHRFPARHSDRKSVV